MHDFERVPRHTTRLAWMPAKIHADGSIENIIQGKPEKKGPMSGHWAKKPKQIGRSAPKAYKRFWIEGQHNYMRQRDPRHPDEAIIGSKVQNMNIKMQVIKDARQFEEGAIALSYGMMKRVDVTTHDDIFAEAKREAKRVLEMKPTSEKQGVNCDDGGARGIRVGGGL